MKLETVLTNLNSLEKNSFLKIVDTIISNNPKNAKNIEKILSDESRELKNIDSINITRIFELIKDEYMQYVKSEFVNLDSQLDIVTDILTRDGRCIARHDESKMKEFPYKLLMRDVLIQSERILKVIK